MISFKEFRDRILKENLGRCNICTIHLPSGSISIMQTTNEELISITFYTSEEPILHPGASYPTSGLKKIFISKCTKGTKDDDLEDILKKLIKNDTDHVRKINEMVINIIKEYLNDMEIKDPWKTKPTYTELNVHTSTIIGYLDDPAVEDPDRGDDEILNKNLQILYFKLKERYEKE